MLNYIGYLTHGPHREDDYHMYNGYDWIKTIKTFKNS